MATNKLYTSDWMENKNLVSNSCQLDWFHWVSIAHIIYIFMFLLLFYIRHISGPIPTHTITLIFFVFLKFVLWQARIHYEMFSAFCLI